ncbi:MAG: metallophosphoesterase [Candidatus Hydrogenedentes bacterium]|nr:metallophosphoesterase [Candidatus Hydrogenedentota bacterium]
MKDGKISRRDFLRAGALGATLVAAGGCFSLQGNAHPYHPLPYAARLQVKHPSQFRILQLTDIHFEPDTDPVKHLENKRSETMIAALITQAKPDLVMVTGDSWVGNQKLGGEDRMREAVARFVALGTPWAYAWGNHDRLIDNAQGHKELTEAKNSLYRGAETGGNYVIDIVNTREDRVCQLVCLNSECDGLGASQQAWMKTLADDTAKAGRPQPLRVAFFHIPIKQYAEIWDKHAASGLKGENCCIEKEDGSSLAYLKMLGVRACFCGHDHVNNYSGISDGVELVYGRASGVGGYGGDRVPKGGTLITINCRTGRYDWAALLPNQPVWRPKPGEQITIPEPKK